MMKFLIAFVTVAAAGAAHAGTAPKLEINQTAVSGESRTLDIVADKAPPKTSGGTSAPKPPATPPKATEESGSIELAQAQPKKRTPPPK